METRWKGIDFKASSLQLRRRIEASATRGVRKQFLCALKHNPREVANPKPDIRMCEEELEVLFDRLHPGTRSQKSWRRWCPTAPPSTHLVVSFPCLAMIADCFCLLQVRSLTGLEDLAPGEFPFNVEIGGDVYFPAPLWRTTKEVEVVLFPSQARHNVQANLKLIMLDDTGTAAKANVLHPADSADGELLAGLHLVCISFDSIASSKPVQVLLRPGTEKLSLRFERAHCPVALWTEAMAFLFP